MGQSPVSFCEMLVAALHEGCGLSINEAKESAIQVVEWGARNGHSGSVHYWPTKFRDMSPQERADAIRERFTGNNLAEVCREFDVSHMTVYRAIKG